MLFFHLRQYCLAAQEYTGQVDTDYPVPVSHGDIADHAVGQVHCRAVDQHVNAVEFFNCLFRDAGNVFFFRYIRGDTDRCSPLCGNECRGRITVLFITAYDDHRCPFTGEGDCYPASDTAAASGDDSNFIFQFHSLHLFYLI